MTLFLQLFALAGLCYVAVFAREQLRRRRRRQQRRRQWRALDRAASPRTGSGTPTQVA